MIACNAITGAGDLGVCEGADCPNASEPAPVRDAGTLTNADARAPDAAPPPPPSCAGCPEACVDGACAPFPSCRNPAGATCGTPAGSCCASLPVPGGTFNRGNSASYPATVGAFRLDQYEVTVARFRAFVEAGLGVSTNPPAPGAGAHPRIVASGWVPEWNGELAASTAALKARLAGGTWTDAPGDGELRPITNVRWFEAFAFCAWDGGRLPTNAEWEYAASGGSEQRYYPWSDPPSSTTIDDTYAAYHCAVSKPAYTCPPSYCAAFGPNSGPCDATTCSAAGSSCVYPACYGCASPADVANVGSYPKGAGKWGQLDLGGNAMEWVLDQTGNFDKGVVLPNPCVDCASLVTADLRGISVGAKDDAFILLRGGGWSSTAGTTLRSTRIDYDHFDATSNSRGFRCARD